MLDALRAREISASELLEMHLSRIERLDGPLNSIIARDFEAARKAAAAADALLSQSDADATYQHRPLLGLPITVKESIDVIGMATTAGVEFRKGHRAEKDAPTVKRLRDAGAIVIGKTNVCPWLADFIADNPIYGRTNNPWDHTKTPGGSSGGSAAVAAGFSPLDLGSDLGGSIRIPAAFCGLWGHKPSEGAVPNSGNFPGSPLPNAGWIMAAQGPIARSAGDLALALNVLAGPDVGMDAAWKLQFPPARRKRLQDFRVAVMPWLEWIPVDAEIIQAMENLCDRLRSAGAVVETARVSGTGDWKEYYRLYRRFMATLTSARWPAPQRAGAADDRRRRGGLSNDADALGLTSSGADYLDWHAQRETYRQAYRDFFAQWDILLTPSALTPAFAHPTLPVIDRAIDVAGRSIEFDYLSFYPGVATLAGHGATAFPFGFTTAGLPIGAQAIGPFLEDPTPLAFAAAMEQEYGGFIAPRL